VTDFTEEELRAAGDFLLRYGDGKHSVEQAALAMRNHRARKAKADRSKYLVRGALRALSASKRSKANA
jgi:hypothetical protein